MYDEPTGIVPFLWFCCAVAAALRRRASRTRRLRRVVSGAVRGYLWTDCHASRHDESGSPPILIASDDHPAVLSEHFARSLLASSGDDASRSYSWIVGGQAVLSPRAATWTWRERKRIMRVHSLGLSGQQYMYIHGWLAVEYSAHLPANLSRYLGSRVR